MEILVADKADYQALIDVWEASVRATHQFLAEADVQALKPLILAQYFDAVSLHCVKNAEGAILGFSGCHAQQLEMLFIAPAARGQGIGSALVKHALCHQGVTRVDVNEQNSQAVGFYLHLGGHVIGRSAVDGQGKPYPLLHLSFANTLSAANARRDNKDR